jgi:cell division transport system permease protein
MKLALREALLAFRRAPLLSLLSITTIAFSLFAFGLFGLVALNLRDALRKVEERVELRAFIAYGTAVETSAGAMSEIGGFREVQSAVYVSPDQALARSASSVSSATCSRGASSPPRSRSGSSPASAIRRR